MLQQHSGYDQQFQFRQMQNVAGSSSMMQPQGSGSDSGFHFEAAAFPVLSNSNRITGRPPIGSAQSSSTGIAHRSPQISGMSLPGEPPFSITGDDFPALSSSASSHSVGAISSAAQAAVRPPGFGKMPLGSESSPSGLSGMDSMYGLLGLLDVVRMTDKVNEVASFFFLDGVLI